MDCAVQGYIVSLSPEVALPLEHQAKYLHIFWVNTERPRSLQGKHNIKTDKTQATAC